ncbi:hypothetical protein B0H14DRAFT_3478906 [Mycena olivaceomarginata]|nr:hypothetical protein B0H14DRAFT_3478906 [Mycena olivaceomarginata]
MLNSERAYIDLIFRVTKKYAALGSRAVKAGDYGRITRGRWGLAFWRKNGIFVREGNIYLDGKAEKYGLQLLWNMVDTSFSAGGLHPLVAQCNAKAAYKFSLRLWSRSRYGEPDNPIIDPPGR